MARDHDHDAVEAPRFESTGSEVPHATAPGAASHPGEGAPTEAACFEPPAAGTALGGGAAPDSEATPIPRRSRVVDARTLLGDGRILHIEHGGEVYMLRLTRNDRLILTK